jgi:hypothetical protein
MPVARDAEDVRQLLAALSYITFIPPIVRSANTLRDCADIITMFLGRYFYDRNMMSSLPYRPFSFGMETDDTAPVFEVGFPRPPAGGRIPANQFASNWDALRHRMTDAQMALSPLTRIFQNLGIAGQFFGRRTDQAGRHEWDLFELNLLRNDFAQGYVRMVEFISALITLLPARGRQKDVRALESYNSLLRQSAIIDNIRHYFTTVNDAANALNSISYVPQDRTVRRPQVIANGVAILGMVCKSNFESWRIKPNVFSMALERREVLWSMNVIHDLGTVAFSPNLLPGLHVKERRAIWKLMIAEFKNLITSSWVQVRWDWITDYWKVYDNSDLCGAAYSFSITPRALLLQWVGLLNSGSSIAIREGIVTRAMWGQSTLPMPPTYPSDLAGLPFRGITAVELTNPDRSAVGPTYTAKSIRVPTGSIAEGLPAGGLPAPSSQSPVLVQYDVDGPYAGLPAPPRPVMAPAVPWLKMELIDNTSGTNRPDQYSELVEKLKSVDPGMAPTIPLIYSWSDTKSMWNDMSFQMTPLRPSVGDALRYFPEFSPELFERGPLLQFIQLRAEGKLTELGILQNSVPPL